VHIDLRTKAVVFDSQLQTVAFAMRHRPNLAARKGKELFRGKKVSGRKSMMENQIDVRY